jgi:hypothetical protein
VRFIVNGSIDCHDVCCSNLCCYNHVTVFLTENRLRSASKSSAIIALHNSLSSANCHYVLRGGKQNSEEWSTLDEACFVLGHSNAGNMGPNW